VNKKGVLTVIGALIVIWLLLSVIGLVIKGLFWLFIIGVVLLAITALFGGARSRR
jgi:hypothetical protein